MTDLELVRAILDLAGIPWGTPPTPISLVEVTDAAGAHRFRFEFDARGRMLDGWYRAIGGAHPWPIVAADPAYYKARVREP